MSRTGTWWCKEEEINVVAISEEDELLLLGECKWTSSPVGESLLSDLEEKASSVRWRSANRHEHFVLFSKNGFTEALQETAQKRDDLFLYGLPEIATLIDVAAVSD